MMSQSTEVSLAFIRVCEQAPLAGGCACEAQNWWKVPGNTVLTGGYVRPVENANVYRCAVNGQKKRGELCSARPVSLCRCWLLLDSYGAAAGCWRVTAY